MLNKIKNILKIILTSLLIVNLFQSCARAETLTKLENAYTNEQVMGYLLDNITIYTNKTIDGITWTNFKSNWENETDNVVFMYYYNNNASSSVALTAEFYYGSIEYNTTTQSAPSTTNLSSNNLPVKYINNLGNNNGTAYFQSRTYYSVKFGNAVNNNYLKYFIYKDDNENWWQYTNNENISLENIQTGLDFELASTKSITNYEGDGLYWYFQYPYSNSKWLLGTYTNSSEFDEVVFRLRDSDTDDIIATAFTSASNNTDGLTIDNGKLFIDNYKIYLNQRYYIEYECYLDGQIADYFAYQIVFMNRNAVITNGEIVNIGSGDNYTNQDQTNTELNFWQQTYQKMFTTSGDYIQSKFDEVKNELHISGDSELEKSFIELITENHDDFVISWDTFQTPYMSLSGDSINFSQLERDSEELHEAMEWERIIVSFALGSLLLRNYWTTFLMALGIGTQVYDKEDEEKTIVSYNENGDRSITRTKRVGNLTIRRKSK